MDRLSTEGRLIEAAHRSGNLTLIRNGSALRNTSTGVAYGRLHTEDKVDGRIARVGLNGGDIAFLNQSKTMFVPSGRAGSIDTLSESCQITVDDILAPKTWGTFLRRTTPYAIDLTAGLLGIAAGHLLTESAKTLTDSLAHRLGFDGESGHQVQNSQHNDPSATDDISHVQSRPEHLNASTDGHSPSASSGNVETTPVVPASSSRSLREDEAHPKKFFIRKIISRLAICDDKKAREFIEDQCKLFEDRMHEMVEIIRMHAPESPDWPVSPRPGDIELMAKAVVAASEACERAYAEKTAGKPSFPRPDFPPEGYPDLFDGKPFLYPMPKPPPDDLQTMHMFRKPESYTEDQKLDSTFIFGGALVGAYIGRNGGPTITAAMIALGAIAGAFLRLYSRGAENQPEASRS